jgi:hypothetical protein
MDAIGDAELGIDAFLGNEFPSDPGSRYVAIYGVLQLSCVEQDAIQALRETFNMKGDLPDAAKAVRHMAPETLEGRCAGGLLQDVPVDEDQVAAALGALDHMRVPDPVEQGGRGGAHRDCRTFGSPP